MAQKINIYQNASGSLRSSMGDGCLFYTQGYSEDSRFINENLSDNPPVLNKDYATAIWKFFPAADRYALIHVQGSHIVNQSMGRNYPFRGVYEVSRNDMNDANFPLGNVIASMPRIEDFPAASMKHDIETELRPAISSDLVLGEIDGIRYLIEDAILAEQKVELQLGHQNGLRENGVLSCREFRTLLAAIDRLPVELKRYATFVFCGDEHFASFSNEVLINVYAATAQNAPAGKTLMWLDAVKHRPQHTAVEYAYLESIATMLPGKDRPLVEVQAMLKAMAQYKTVIANIENVVRQRQYTSLQPNHWDAWFLVGHKLHELSINNWAEFTAVYNSFPEARKTELATTFHKVCKPWKLTDLTETIYKVMPFTPQEKLDLQDMALRPFLFSNYQTYNFLFYDTKKETHNADNPFLIPQNLRSHLDAFFIQQINAKSIAGIDKWRKIFEIQGCLSDSNKKAFDTLYRNRIASKVGSQNAVQEICHIIEAIIDPKTKNKEDEQILLRMTSTDFKNAFAHIPNTPQGLAELEHLLKLSMQLPAQKWSLLVEPQILENAVAFIRQNFKFDDLNFWADWFDKQDQYPQIHQLVRLCLRNNDFGEAQKLAKHWCEKVQELSGKEGKKKTSAKEFAKKTGFVVKATADCLKKSENDTNKKMAKKIENLYENVRYNGKWIQKPVGKSVMRICLGLVLGLIVGGGITYLCTRSSAEPKDDADYLVVKLNTYEKPLMVTIAELDSTAAGKVIINDSTITFNRNNPNEIATLHQKAERTGCEWLLYYTDDAQKTQKSCTISDDSPLFQTIQDNTALHALSIVAKTEARDSIALSSDLYNADFLTHYFNLVKEISRKTADETFAY